MKKLIISMVATASIALVAKAVVLNGTSFENYQGANGFQVGLDDSGLPNGYLYWSGGDDAQFEFIDVVEEAKAVRPKYWADQANVNDAKALAIDVDTPLARNIAPTEKGEGVPQNIGDGLYFDSMVQFTATTDAPTVSAGDKLIVWLKENEIEGEDSTYALWVTAGVWDDVKAERCDYEITNVNVAPDSWHRLSIAVKMAEGDIPTFNVYVDGVEAKAGDVVDFQSLVYDDGGMLWKQITSVSFQGKGAIDDLVWTTEDPFYVAPVIEKVNVSVAINDFDAISVAFFDGTDQITSGTTAWECDKNSSHTIMFMLKEGYQLVSSSPVAVVDAETGAYTINVMPDSDTRVTIVTAPVEEPVAKPFTVTIGETTTTYATLAKAIAAAKGATIKLTETAKLSDKLTVAEAAVIDLNGQRLTLAETDNYAVVVKAALTITDSSSEKSGTVVVPGEYGFGMTAGSLTINAGNFVATDTDFLIGAWAGTVAISGGDFTAEYCVVNLFAADASAEISGGTFTVAEESDGYPCYAILSEVGGKVAVSAGRFSTIVEEAFCAEGYIPTTEAVEGYYTVVRGYAVTVEADNAEVSALADKYAEGATVTFTVTPVTGDYEVTSVTMNGTSLTADNGTYTFTMPAEAVRIVVTTEAVNNEPEYPEITPEDEDEDVKDFSDAVKAVIEAAFTPQGGTYNPPAALTVISNGVELKGNKAVDMIEEIVEKFEGNPFTADGKLELTFKVTDVMEVLKGAGNGFTLTVGTATLKDTYEVAPKYIDLATKAESFDPPADGGAVIFKLVIKPVAAQQN